MEWIIIAEYKTEWRKYSHSDHTSIWSLVDAAQLFEMKRILCKFDLVTSCCSCCRDFLFEQPKMDNDKTLGTRSQASRPEKSYWTSTKAYVKSTRIYCLIPFWHAWLNATVILCCINVTATANLLGKKNENTCFQSILNRSVQASKGTVQPAT